MTLHSYYSNSGKDLILDYINNLPEDEKTDGFSVLECMENGEFDKIRFKRWEKKVYEVYFQKHNRIFYIAVDKENIYLLHACHKQKNKTERKDKKLVRIRASELGGQLGKKFILRRSRKMPFVEINVKNEIEKQKQNDPEFRKAWDDSRAEYRLIGEMISLRKQENITQKKLASLTGNKQQVISRIERKESIPTIRAFSHILDALGYELQIVKKK